MESIERFFKNDKRHDPESIDFLIELASHVRILIRNNQQEEINRILQYTMEHRYFESFIWCIGLLQEELEKTECTLDSFEFAIGKSIPDYDEFIKLLQVDFHVLENGLKTVCDMNGEVDSFFNILVYKTGYKNIHLISSENFDTKDNDYIQYKLSFARS